MKIVNICAYFTSPPMSGGQERVHYFNKELSRHHTIEQFSYTPVLCRKKTYHITGRYTERIKNPLAYTAAVVILKWLGIRNYDFIIPTAFRLVRPNKELRRALKSADIVQVEHPWLAGWVSRYTNKPIILVEHNAEFSLQKSFFKHGLKKTLIMRRIIHVEKEAIVKASLVFTTCEEDLELLSKAYGAPKSKFAVVTNGVDSPGSLRKSSHPKPIVLFIGSSHPPNNEAAGWIERELAPRMPECQFLLVGGVCNEKRFRNVNCTGKIHGLETYLRMADVAINPVEAGSGTNLKMLKYMSRGIPVITTKTGCRGIGNSGGYILAPREKFKSAIRHLLGNSRKAKEVADKGLKACKDYSWRKIAEASLPYYRMQK